MLQRFATLATIIVLATSCTSQHSTPAASTTSRTRERAAALEKLYAERLRLGLGSPYRLIDAAMHDERLGDERAQVARALLDQIEDGDLYDLSPLVFVAAGVSGSNAVAHFDLIQKTIESAQDPRVGELAIALAYEAAARDSVVTPHVAGRAARVAALIRDRELAMADARRLREAARQRAVRPEHLVRAWRDEYRFAVERPTLAPLDAMDQRAAARLAMLLGGGIRAAALPVDGFMRRTAGDLRRPSEIIAGAIARDGKTEAPQSALIITMRAIRASSHDANLRVSAPHWQEFFDRAVDEESFVTSMAAARVDDADDVVAAGITLDAAIALRPFAQDRAAPAAAAAVQELRSRFGVAVSFGSSITSGERTRVAGILRDAIVDMQSVAPSLSVHGLTFRVAPIAPNTRHLAFHDPARRIIHLDPAAAAGTIAHEIAHDLDWQMSKRKYRTKSNYATDYAARNGRVLAYAVSSLVAERALMGDPAELDASAERPAEVFARRFEWYIASALALRGRSNGYLSPVQNDWITGYSSAVRPEPTAAAARAFAELLAEATRMNRSERDNIVKTVAESTPAAIYCRATTQSPARSPLRTIQPGASCNTQPSPFVGGVLAPTSGTAMEVILPFVREMSTPPLVTSSTPQSSLTRELSNAVPTSGIGVAPFGSKE